MDRHGRRDPDAARAERLRRALALEIARVVDDLRRRRPFLVAVWGRHRARAPFLDTTFHRWRTLGHGELLDLTLDELDALDAFYRELEDLRLYLGFTEDMPRTLALRVDGALARLERLAQAALDALGEHVDHRPPFEAMLEVAPPMDEEPVPVAPVAWLEE